MVQTVTDVRNALCALARELDVRVVGIGKEYARNVAYEERRAGDLELEVWAPGNRDGARYKVYQYRTQEYANGPELTRDEPYGGYTCGAGRMVDKLAFARAVVAAMAQTGRTGAR